MDGYSESENPLQETHKMLRASFGRNPFTASEARNRLAGLTRAELEQLVHHGWIYPLNSVVFMMPGAD